MARQITYGPITANATIIDLAMAKMNSKITFDEENDLLEIFVDAANAEIENYIGAPVLQRDETLITWDHWCTRHALPFPVRELLSLEWKDATGTTAELSEGSDYELFDDYLILDIDKPSDFKYLVLTCKTGYIPEAMPADIKRAALLIFAHADTYRENMPLKLNSSARALLRPYRRY